MLIVNNGADFFVCLCCILSSKMLIVNNGAFFYLFVNLEHVNDP